MILTMRCDQASHLMSDSLDRRLEWHERLALRGHMFACRTCPLLFRQLRSVRQFAQSYYSPAMDSVAERNSSLPLLNLESSAKERIKRRVREAASKARGGSHTNRD